MNLEFKRRVEATEMGKCQKKEKKIENEASKKYPYLEDEERRKQIILQSVYLDKKKNQKNIINLEVERLPGLR